MTTTRPTFHLTRALQLIADHRCPCEGCPGSLTESEWPSWRRCEECRCHWREDNIRGKRYACTIRGRCRPEQDAAAAARRSE